ncbi:glycosyltransferase [Demequina sp. NBRC 110057]|uniref:UDP-N-acetylglucosamine--N-acetylmuramyl- (pentapeptide) pyrophosphoryl-undecaprenol N-acetylglucosamine transferase n=1 Tax=Demequina sp. NBRC 110057 TaxID=1570346 RepID=UPI001F20E02E|nr:UDP-N-acetylglucosamine--N-acetylmuramyl-(pentapeptide) pyrophosphoryl-undecaprenol N-acetylglucosamine transferase [Demequina sp. NBRC 110057]
MANFLVAGGGTAGHVNPMLATAHALTERGHSVAALGTAQGLEADLVPRAGLTLHEVPKVPLPRRPSGDLLRLPRNWAAAVGAATRAIEATAADAVIGFGGYVSTPAYRAARKAGIPIIVHEANARPGLANRLGARWTRHVAVTAPGTPLPHAVVTGLPLLPAVQDLAEALADPSAAPALRAEARAALGWAEDAPVLVITGGSLGAASLNAATVGAVARLVEHGIHVWHLTGRGKADDALRAQGDLPAATRGLYRVDEFSHDMSQVFAAASAVVCRSGAGAVAEATAMRLPAVYVPLPHGNGEQALNAMPAVEAGAAALVEDSALTPAALEQQAERLLLEAGVADSMREAAARFGIIDGAARVATMAEEAL